MDVRRLRMLLELSRLGSMHEVADALGTTTSSVSQGIAALARDVGSPLLEPDGRRVRLTPAGRRLADHAVTILAAVEAARLDLDPTAEPVGRGAGRRVRLRDPEVAAAGRRRPALDPPRHRGAHPRVRAARVARPAGPRRRRPGSRLRLRPRACGVARRPRRLAAVGPGVGDRGADPRPAPRAGRPRRPRLDRELAPHGGRGRRCAPWPRAPASCRTSCTASTRSSSSTTSCWPAEGSPSCRGGGRRGAA